MTGAESAYLFYGGIGGASASPYQRLRAHNLTGRGLLHYNSSRY